MLKERLTENLHGVFTARTQGHDPTPIHEMLSNKVILILVPFSFTSLRKVSWPMPQWVNMLQSPPLSPLCDHFRRILTGTIISNNPFLRSIRVHRVGSYGLDVILESSIQWISGVKRTPTSKKLKFSPRYKFSVFCGPLASLAEFRLSISQTVKAQILISCLKFTIHLSSKIWNYWTYNMGPH